MADVAPTRTSLLLRLKDSADHESWSLFVDIYSPLVFGLARRSGLQESDAADLVQEVMAEVSRSIAKFEYNPQIGKFRNWLYKVAKRTMMRMQQRQKRQAKGAGGTEAIFILANEAQQQDELHADWDREYEEHLLQWAAEVVRSEFKDNVWQAFWLTSVKQQRPADVAQSLGMNIGTVYVAKSRVMKRLAEKVREIDESQ